ncbi:hypothetical protein HN832_03285 [archaeon]|jgi:DNA mismatch repair protein MutS2|nr:hypothetical protein [archaeon]MBT4373580.1 hypothetical protein [archaeon]MBT4532028.1 hypothetical protein [archaeon]MBT7001695.1 hypothetical protein [archaeon]MBT7282413.1 hypothetical protein [archaeon]
MKETLLKYIQENNLSPFTNSKTPLSKTNNSYKTRDAKSIHNKVLTKISQNFIFPETTNLLNIFNFINQLQEIEKRQNFFQSIKKLGKIEKSFLQNISIPNKTWSPAYDVVVVTEDTDTFSKLKEKNCPAQLLVSETDIALLENRDIVQVLDCDEYKLVLERLDQSVFLNSLDEAYLERHLEQLSTWQHNLTILQNKNLGQRTNEIINSLFPLLDLIQDKKLKILTHEEIENKIEKINEEITEKIKELSISGESLMQMLNKGVLPENIKEIVRETIIKYEIPQHILNIQVPVSIDEPELEKLIKQQSSNEFSGVAEQIKSKAEEIKQIPSKLNELSNQLITFDFISGISQFIEEQMQFPEYSNLLSIFESKNIFLANPQPINFELNSNYKCSILTGANSGGKTTLIEHLIQLISLSNLGLPVYGNLKLPLFEEIYYFAKNKGSASKGAFETLLTQMSKIQPGNKTLILADEIEAVTEPGVAGNIISATAEYYINQNCFLVIATHLGHEIQKVLPPFTRIDGIEAKGLTDNFELIVDHNPVLGRLAHSTPELIVEKMANSEQKEYFKFLNNYLKNKA